MNIKRLLTSLFSVLGLAVALPMSVTAANGYSLFGEATLVSPGNGGSDTAVQLVSDSAPGSAGVDFDVSAGTTFADLNTLATDFNVTDDDCGGGAPRYQINVTTVSGEKNIFAYIGPSPNYTGCTPNTWDNTGDLLESGMTVDTSQLGGTFYDDYDNAVANYGTLEVTGIQLVTDSGWFFADGEQTILVDNANINGTIFAFEAEAEEPVTKDECKKGGWQDFDGMFKNQGDCVSFVATDGRNPGSGQ